MAAHLLIVPGIHAAPVASEAPEGPVPARVIGTQGDGLRVRQGPGVQFPIVVTIREGSRLQIIDGPEPDREGHLWYRVGGFDRAGNTGWSASEFLTRLDGDLDPAWNGLTPTRTITARMTAYTYQPAGHNITRSGTHVRWGVVAVDPTVIPLGTRLAIEGYDNVFVAEDTGGGVRGNHVDIFFPDYASAIRFGVQQRQVTILQ